MPPTSGGRGRAPGERFYPAGHTPNSGLGVALAKIWYSVLYRCDSLGFLAVLRYHFFTLPSLLLARSGPLVEVPLEGIRQVL